MTFRGAQLRSIQGLSLSAFVACLISPAAMAALLILARANLRYVAFLFATILLRTMAFLLFSQRVVALRIGLGMLVVVFF